MTHCGDICCAHKDRITLDEHQTARARVPGMPIITVPDETFERMMAEPTQGAPNLRRLAQRAAAERARPDHATLLAAESARVGKAEAAIRRVRALAQEAEANYDEPRLWASEIYAALDGEPDGR